MPAPAAQRSRRLRALHAHLRTAPAAATEAETQDITAEQRQSMIEALPTAVQRRMKNMSEEEQDALLAYMAEKKAEEVLLDGPELVLPTVAPDTPVPPKMMHRLNELQLLDSAREIDDIGYVSAAPLKATLYPFISAAAPPLIPAAAAPRRSCARRSRSSSWSA